MIDEDATFKKYGYHSDDLSYGSSKKIVAVCDICGDVRYLAYQRYRPTCIKHVNVGRKHTDETKSGWAVLRKDYWEVHEHPSIGRKQPPEEKAKQIKAQIGHSVSDETRQTISEANTGYQHTEYAKLLMRNAKLGLSGEDTNHWQGGFDASRPYVLPFAQCDQLNDRFVGSDGHHITKSLVVFIPTELHKHIPHNIKTGANMGEMNMLALQFINGGYDG